jgi:hypothetical protein
VEKRPERRRELAVTTSRWSRIRDDLRDRRNVEVYAAAGLAVIFAILSVIGDIVPENLRWAAIYAGLGLLVYRLTLPELTSGEPGSTVGDRTALEATSFTERLQGVRELWVYGPSAVNFLSPSHTEALRKMVLDKPDGLLRVVVLDPSVRESMDIAVKQLDESELYGTQRLQDALNRSIAQLAEMEQWSLPGKVEHRYLPYNPGFSLVVINPNSREGRIILELHGFRNESIGSRMHFEIAAEQDPRWFSYWTQQFESIWASSSQVRPQRRPEMPAAGR